MSETEIPYLLLINGPNLNRLGMRDQTVYGTSTLADVVQLVESTARNYSVGVRNFQSNSEGALIDFIQANAAECVGIIINPGAFGHYSIALHDCLLDTQKPIVEVHISNVHKREPFRHQLVLAAAVTGQIVGLGIKGYKLATEYLLA